VPKSHLEDVQHQFIELQHTMQYYDTETVALGEDLLRDDKKLEEVEVDMRECRTHYATLLKDDRLLQRCYTPRPDWDKIFTQVPELVESQKDWGTGIEEEKKRQKGEQDIVDAHAASVATSGAQVGVGGSAFSSVDKAGGSKKAGNRPAAGGGSKVKLNGKGHSQYLAAEMYRLVEQFRVERGIGEELVTADARLASTQRELQDTRAQLQEAKQIQRKIEAQEKEKAAEKAEVEAAA